MDKSWFHCAGCWVAPSIEQNLSESCWSPHDDSHSMHVRPHNRRCSQSMPHLVGQTTRASHVAMAREIAWVVPSQSLCVLNMGGSQCTLHIEIPSDDLFWTFHMKEFTVTWIHDVLCQMNQGVLAQNAVLTIPMCGHTPRFQVHAKQTTRGTDESINDERVSPTHKVSTDFTRCNVCLAFVSLEKLWGQTKKELILFVSKVLAWETTPTIAIPNQSIFAVWCDSNAYVQTVCFVPKTS